MYSTKSRPKTRRLQEPQRRNGKLRVAAIFKAAAAVFAEKGFEGATMAEIAASSDTKIGSLYRFFPNKEILADALISNSYKKIEIEFDKINAKIQSLSVSALADALLFFMVELRKDAGAIVKLMEAYKGWSVKREAFRASVLKQITKTLMLRCPGLLRSSAQDIAVVILHNMKAMKALSVKGTKEGRPGAISELRAMTRLYLKSRLKNHYSTK